jgi:hypothetical protein
MMYLQNSFRTDRRQDLPPAVGCYKGADITVDGVRTMVFPAIG